MLVLEGPQGLRKSSALRALFSTPWFTDHIPDLHNKDAALQIQGIWCLEHAEMATLGRADANRAKEFISRRVDRFRPPFGKLTQDFPRQCVFAASVNPSGSGYLRDETGARRFWPILCGQAWESGERQIDADAIEDIRDQLWAEAVAQYRAGAVWWLDTRNLEQMQTEAADARFDADEWVVPISAFIADKHVVRVGDVLSGAMLITPRDQSRAFQIRAGAVLRALGWTRKRVRLDDRPQWVFTSPHARADTIDRVAEFRADIRALAGD